MSEAQKPASFLVVPITDVPGYQFEINWTDASGEPWSEECVDLDDVLARLAQVGPSLRDPHAAPERAAETASEPEKPTAYTADVAIDAELVRHCAREVQNDREKLTDFIHGEMRAWAEAIYWKFMELEGHA